MPQKWNLQDIRPASAKQQPRETPVSRPRGDIAPRVPPEESLDDSDIATIDVVDGNRIKRKRVVVTTVVALLIVILGFFMNVLLGGASVTVFPKFKDVSVQANFIAYKSPESGQLGYELMTLEATGERQVKATGKEEVSERAEGTIFIYNTKNTSQRLIKNTRFESQDGLIFKIKESVDVPPATKDAKGATVPGSVSAEVFADGTGEQYNLSPQRFHVFLFKGTDDYEKIYAESTTAFEGGFDGERYIIDEQELNTAKQALHVELRDRLLARLSEERPAGFIIYDDAVTFVYESQPSTEYGDSLATIKETARLQVPMFKEQEFAAFLAENTIPEYVNEPVTITDPKTLMFAYASTSVASSDIAQLSSFEFTLNGNTQVVWLFDSEKLKQELISIKKTDGTKIFSAYPSISQAQAKVRPFWATTFPDTPEEITIETVIGTP